MTQKMQGIIVVDACALKRLDSPQSSTNNYLELLSFLGRQGYRILIPEMVSMETSSILSDKTDISAIINSLKNGKNSNLHHFLNLAKAGKLPGVEIIHSGPNSVYGNYLHSLREITNDANLSRNVKCALLSTEQSANQGKNYGEIACMDALENILIETPEPPPLYFLSDDRDALRNCSERFAGSVNRLNGNGFIGGFSDMGVKRQALMNDHYSTVIDCNGSLDGNDSIFQRRVDALIKASKAVSPVLENEEAIPMLIDTPSNAQNGHAVLNTKPIEFLSNPHQGVQNMQQELTSNNEAEASAYENYKNSFGGQVYVRRNERKMTPEDLANAILELTKQEGISKRDVLNWEFAAGVPNRAQLDVLVDLLIEKNSHIPQDEKGEAKEIFIAAYNKSEELIKKATPNDPISPQRSSFGRLLREHAEDAEISATALADAITKKNKIEFESEETRLLSQEPVHFIGAIEAGAVPVSKGLALALVSTLDKVKTLSDEDKQSLYDAYQASNAHQFSPSRNGPKAANENRPRSRSPRPEANMTPSARALELKEEIKALFREDGDTNIARIVANHTRKKHTHGATSVVYALLNDSTPSLLQLKQSLSGTSESLLSEYLEAQGKTREIETLHTKLGELRKEVGHRSHGSSLRSAER